MKLIMVVELEYDESVMHADDEEALEWFYNETLFGGDLILHSNDIGESVGTVKVLEMMDVV